MPNRVRVRWKDKSSEMFVFYIWLQLEIVIGIEKQPGVRGEFVSMLDGRLGRFIGSSRKPEYKC